MSVTCSQGSKSLNKELDSLQLLILEIFLYFHNTIQFVQEPVINACQFVYLIHCIVLVKRLEMKSNSLSGLPLFHVNSKEINDTPCLTSLERHDQKKKKEKTLRERLHEDGAY